MKLRPDHRGTVHVVINDRAYCLKTQVPTSWSFTSQATLHKSRSINLTMLNFHVPINKMRIITLAISDFYED